MKIVIKTVCCMLVLLVLGCGGSDKSNNQGVSFQDDGSGVNTDQRPEGVYNYVVDSGAIEQGCSDDFLAFINNNTGQGGVGEGEITTFQFTLSLVGQNSISFTFNNLDEVVLSPSENIENVWVGVISANATVSGCQLTESLAIGVEDLGSDKIQIDILDEWNNVSINLDCPFQAGSCMNAFSMEAIKI